jgi:hypothetical protein
VNVQRQHNEIHQTVFEKGRMMMEEMGNNGGDELVQSTLYTCMNLLH